MARQVVLQYFLSGGVERRRIVDLDDAGEWVTHMRAAGASGVRVLRGQTAKLMEGFEHPMNVDKMIKQMLEEQSTIGQRNPEEYK